MASNKKSKVDLVEIDAARINDVCDNYFKWKSLNDSLKSFCSRGINMPDSISEPIGCFCLDYFWNKGSGGDAITRDGRKVEFKACSNFDSDLTSFGPTCEFDNFVFLRFNLNENLCYVYDTGLSSDEVKKLRVNSTQTIEDQQKLGRRPHIRIIDEVINKLDLKPTCIFNIRRCEIFETVEV